jgi:hypothetical protein
MKKKIKEIAEQAGLKLDELPDDVYIPLEDFAELLIRDCAKQVNNVYKQGGGTYGESILKHYNLPIYVKDKK